MSERGDPGELRDPGEPRDPRDPGELRGPEDPGEPKELGVFEDPPIGLVTFDHGGVPAKLPAIPDIESSGDFSVSSPPTGDVIGDSFGTGPTPRFDGSFCNGEVRLDTEDGGVEPAKADNGDAELPQFDKGAVKSDCIGEDKELMACPGGTDEGKVNSPSDGRGENGGFPRFSGFWRILLIPGALPIAGEL